MKIEDIKIDPEFKDLLCPLSEYEERALEGSLLANGCLSPLIVEEKLGVLIDGHNRLRLCKEHDIPFEVKTIMLGGREPAENFIIQNQLGRRNLTPERLEIYIAQLYESAKKKAGFEKGEQWEGNADGVNQHSRIRGQNDPASKSHETAKKVAKQVNRSEKTIRRTYKKIKAIKQAGKIKEYGDGVVPKKEVKAILEASKPVRRQSKAEADEEAELIAENPEIFKQEEAQELKIQKPDNINPIIEVIKAANLTKQEIKDLIQFLKSL
jgi:hypothetical protein